MKHLKHKKLQKKTHTHTTVCPGGGHRSRSEFIPSKTNTAAVCGTLGQISAGLWLTRIMILEEGKVHPGF